MTLRRCEKCDYGCMMSVCMAMDDGWDVDVNGGV